jgi:hypothetical protein
MVQVCTVAEIGVHFRLFLSISASLVVEHPLEESILPLIRRADAVFAVFVTVEECINTTIPLVLTCPHPPANGKKLPISAVLFVSTGIIPLASFCSNPTLFSVPRFLAPTTTHIHGLEGLVMAKAA